METRSRVPVPLSGAVVIVGDYAEASGDLHPVPTGGKARMSGMEIVAHEARSLAEGDFLADAPKGAVVAAALFSFFTLSAFFLIF